MGLRTWKLHMKGLSSCEYAYLREICRLSKNVYNESIYNIRQHYFTEGQYLRFEANYWIMKNSSNYSLLGALTAQQSMKAADQAFKSFFAIKRRNKQGQYSSWRVNLPRYLPKDGFYPVIFPQTNETHKTGEFTIPVSYQLKLKYPELWHSFILKLPEYIIGKKIHLIKVVPKQHGRYFEAHIVFDDDISSNTVLDATKAISIDFGVSNFATCVTSTGKSFIIDGKKVKSINQWYNKENARLQSVKDKQKIKGCTKRQYFIASKRDRQIQDFIYKSAKYIVKYCIDNQIGNIVIGYNDGFQDKVNLGKVNNQQFVMLPYGKFKLRLEYLCNLYGIMYQIQEESYTSKASFWDKDEMPKWNPLNPKQGNFSGKRIHRGLYQTKSGKLLNADVNGALNILRKSSVVSLEALYSRGAVQTPRRIRLA